ncbi:alkaline phosphatase [Terasakiispira papahanaumokuakeensis]|uniref:Alkaline phosphatase n=1 Tax=Terasakiispira papahanaumokuakeensis TaxID=197479 RepID=A0A1E2VDE4_9GAMM|nr:alkaline phosphatase D family protein [Terasakiispira papahanaumokuakeensis]ODC04882.1 alkaline phosphatase [Terasakiispira papahanaumokuakeensis]
MPQLSRRDFLKASALTAGAFTLSLGIAGCSDHDSHSDGDDQNVSFRHGVASGDPLIDGVIIWTRVTPEVGQTSVTLQWEVAKDAGFTQLTHNGEMQATADHDFTLKVDVRNLSSDSVYFYRFKVGGTVSPTGITRTLPTVTDQVRLAVVSCSNYPAGYFNVYNAIQKIADEQSLDALVHLGDYIYEYGTGGYSGLTEHRALPAGQDTELLTLSDYRQRYALYHTDADLQDLHARLPWIVIWDDHEVANDTWKEGAENHNPGEGDFDTRKAAALQAYFEWLPIRPAHEDDDTIIYRSFQYGDLVALQMLDTRIIARDEQLSYSDFMSNNGAIDQAALAAALTDSSRQLVGTEQLNWLSSALMQSANSRWQVLGQQVLMARMTLPVELLFQLQAVYSGQAQPTDMEALLQTLVALKQRQQQGETLTAEEQARLNTQLPYNLDAWDGYAVARERVLNLFNAQKSNLVVLAGDTHNAWASQMTLQDGTPVGVEMATSSVSSPGLEVYLQGVDSQMLAQAMALLVDDLRYADLSHRGFLLVDFNETRAQGTWYFIDNIANRNYTLTQGPSWQSQAGSNTLTPA